MRTRPDDVGDGELAAAVRESWGWSPAAVRHVPVGFGDHHWVAEGATGERRFVTVTDLGRRGEQAAAGEFAGLRAALGTAVALAGDGGLDCVVAPLPTARGEAVLRWGERYALSVFPFVDGVAGDFGDAVPTDERGALARLLAGLHRATPAVPDAPAHDVALAARDVVEAALDELGAPWSGGPYAEPARELLASYGAGVLRDVLAWFDALAGRVGGDGTALVITHGEPHPGNVLRAGGRRRLVDWDTVGLAPPERDLWLATAGDPAALEAYAAASGREPSAEALSLYRLRWDLDDLAEFLGEFRGPHRRTPDTELAWGGLAGAVERAVAALPGTAGRLGRPGR
ncbi:phosphotransferase [Streptomyces sp. PT12]|uniref:phosphotransferase n=1 Tax=Streptomyces sp. PT12 TaxID=1510197 RepID=UPI0015EE5F1B|nr:phosphotransferase [Streptomyces sp. PT12]